MALLKAYGYLFRRDLHVFVPELHAHNRVDDFHAGIEEFEVFRFVGGAEHVGVGGIGFFNRHLVVKAAGDHKFGHFVTAAELIDEITVQPRLVNLQFSIGQQAVTIETFDIVAFIGAAIAPDVDAIFFHCRHQHGAGDRAAQRRGVEVGQPTGGVMESATLNRRDPFCDQLFAAVDQTGTFSAILFRAARNSIVVVFVRLTQVSGICIRHGAFFAHP
ncbi:putative uncharacterized protein [Klebsiella variicola CAG:634]|nr:putative uncharacterized protein [Klebsiella variicola CAG:634]